MSMEQIISNMTACKKLRELNTTVNMQGTKVAHKMASENSFEGIIPFEVMKIADDDGWSVAHQLAFSKHFRPELFKKEILEIRDLQGKSVAQILAERMQEGDTVPKELLDKDILTLQDIKGWSVAHELAGKCLLTEENVPKSVLNLKNFIGISVRDNLKTANAVCMER